MVEKAKRTRVVKAVRKTAARSDASVGSIERQIEKDYHLPKGSIRIFLPDGRNARSDKKIRSLRRDWEQSSKKEKDRELPYKGYTASRKFYVCDLIQGRWEDWDDREELEDNVRHFIWAVNRRTQDECPGVTIEWKVSWAKRSQEAAIEIGAPDDTEQTSIMLEDVSDAFIESFDLAVLSFQHDWRL